MATSASFLPSIDAFLRPRLPETCPEDVELGGWYLSPSRHVIEIIGFALFWFPLLWYTAPSVDRQLALTSEKHLKGPSKGRQAYTPRSGNWLGIGSFNLMLFPLALLSLMLVVWHKYNEDRLYFLLQPCHVTHAALLFLLWCPPRSRIGTIGFNIYLVTFFGPLLGMLAADLSCYTQPLELENWFLQHALLIIVPIAWLISERFALFQSWSFFLWAFSIAVIFHFQILAPVSLYSGQNLNYMLCPPSGVLEDLGAQNYRELMTALCALMSVLIKKILIPIICWVSGVQNGPVDTGIPTEDIQKATVGSSKRTRRPKVE